MSHGDKTRRHYIEYHNTLQQSEGMLNHGDNLVEEISNSIDEFRCHGLVSFVCGLRVGYTKTYNMGTTTQGIICDSEKISRIVIVTTETFNAL